jgi:hypothetical protein
MHPPLVGALVHFPCVHSSFVCEHAAHVDLQHVTNLNESVSEGLPPTFLNFSLNTNLFKSPPSMNLCKNMETS